MQTHYLSCFPPSNLIVIDVSQKLRNFGSFAFVT
jgi:hypothetical protein